MSFDVANPPLMSLKAVHQVTLPDRFAEHLGCDVMHITHHIGFDCPLENSGMNTHVKKTHPISVAVRLNGRTAAFNSNSNGLWRSNMLSVNKRFCQFAQAGSLGSLLLLAACDDGQIAKDVKPMPAAPSVEAQVVADAPPAPPPVEVPVEPMEAFDIHFTIGSAELSPDAMESLTSAVDYLRDTPAAHVTLSGYTDHLGSAAANMMLAEKRVASAAEYVEAHGVEASRIAKMSVGEADDALVPAGEDAATWNRRVHVEFEVVPST